jgi:putative peptidoglycan lipid II flippase
MVAGSLLMGSTPVIDQVMAAILGPGCVSALSYGNKIPIGLVSICAMALSTAVLPYFSQMVADGDWQGCKHTLKRYTALNALVSIPATILLMIFSKPIIHLLFQRGAFTSADTEIVSRVQTGYMLQVPFYVLGMIFVRFITAMRRNDLLMYASAVNLVVDIAMNLVLMRIWGVAGIAVSTSFVMFVSFLFVSVCSIKLLSKQTQNSVSRAGMSGPDPIKML